MLLLYCFVFCFIFRIGLLFGLKHVFQVLYIDLFVTRKHGKLEVIFVENLTVKEALYLIYFLIVYLTSN